MDFHYTYPVHAPASNLWDFVNDIPTVGSCIPGATEVVTAEDGTYTGTVTVERWVPDVSQLFFTII